MDVQQALEKRYRWTQNDGVTHAGKIVDHIDDVVAIVLCDDEIQRGVIFVESNLETES